MIEVTRTDVKKMFNNMELGSVVTSKSIPNVNNPSTITWLLRDLYKSGHIEKVDRGSYKLVKRISLKRKKGGGKRKNENLKDISMIPTILKYNKNGLVIKEIMRLYRNLTPEDDQVTMAYMRNLFGYAKRTGVITTNGEDDRFRRSKRGKAPLRYTLHDMELSDEAWNDVLCNFRMYMQGMNKRTNKRKVKPKTVKEKFACCGPIVDHFRETRDNPNKIHTETFFINKVKERLGNERVKTFVVTGPDYFHHMDSIFKTITDKSIVCEIAPDIFDTIYKKAQICKYYVSKKVSLLNCDVDDIAPVNCRYTDIDLMKTIKVNYDLISNQIMRQDLLCDAKKEKYFTFTCTRRRQDSFDVTLKYLKKLLKEHFQADLIALSEGKEVRSNQKSLRSCLQCKPYFNGKGKLLDFYLFKYQDKTPMFNALIVYK